MPSLSDFNAPGLGGATPAADTITGLYSPGFDSGFDDTMDLIAQSMSAPEFNQELLAEHRVRGLRPLPKLTAGDAFANIFRDPVKYLPFVRAVKLVDLYNDKKLADKITAGTATREEEREFNQMLQEQQQEKSLAYKVWDAAFSMVPYSIEVAAGLGIVKGAAKQVLAKSGTAYIAKANKMRSVGKALTATEKATRGAADDLVKYTAEVVNRGAQRLGTRVPVTERIGRNTLGRILPKVTPGSKTAKVAEWVAEGASAGAYASKLQPHNAYKYTAAEFAKQGGAKTVTPALSAELNRRYGSKIAEQIVKEVAEGSFDAAKMAAAAAAKGQALRSAATGMLFEGPLRGALFQQHMAAEEMIRNMTDKYALTEDEQGKLHRVLIEEGDNFLPALTKGVATTLIEASAETGSANFLYYGMQVLGPKLSSTALGGFVDGMLDNSSKNGTLNAAKAMLFGTPGRPGVMTAAGLDGWLPNMVEETVTDLMNAAVGMPRHGGPLGGTLPTLEESVVRGLSFLVNPMNFAAYASDTLNQKTIQATRRMVEGFDKVAQAANSKGARRTSLQEAARGQLTESLEELLEAERSKKDSKEHTGLKGLAYRMYDWVRYDLQRRKLSSIYEANTGHNSADIVARLDAVETARETDPDLLAMPEKEREEIIEKRRADILSLQLNAYYPGLLTTEEAAETASKYGLSVDENGVATVDSKVHEQIDRETVPENAVIVKEHDNGKVDYMLRDEVNMDALGVAFAVDPMALKTSDLVFLMRESPDMLESLVDVHNRHTVAEVDAQTLFGQAWDELSEADQISFARTYGVSLSSEDQMNQGRKAYEVIRAIAASYALTDSENGNRRVALRFRVPSLVIGTRSELESLGAVISPDAKPIGKRGEEDLFEARDNGTTRFDIDEKQTVVSLALRTPRHALMEETLHAARYTDTEGLLLEPMVIVAQEALAFIDQYVEEQGDRLTSEDAETARAIKTMLLGDGESRGTLTARGEVQARVESGMIEEFYFKAFKIGRAGMGLAPLSTTEGAFAPEIGFSSTEVANMDAKLFLHSELGKQLLAKLTDDGPNSYQFFDSPINAVLSKSPGLLNAMLELTPDQAGQAKWVAPNMTPDARAEMEELYAELVKIDAELAELEKRPEDEKTRPGPVASRLKTLRDEHQVARTRMQQIIAETISAGARPIGEGVAQPVRPAQDTERSSATMLDRGDESDITYSSTEQVAEANRLIPIEELAQRLVQRKEVARLVRRYAATTQAKFQTVVERYLDNPWMTVTEFLDSGILGDLGLNAEGHRTTLEAILNQVHGERELTEAQRTTLRNWDAGTTTQEPAKRGTKAVIHGPTGLMREFRSSDNRQIFGWNHRGSGGGAALSDSRKAAGSHVDELGRATFRGEPLQARGDSKQWMKDLYRDLTHVKLAIMEDGTVILPSERWMFIDGDKEGQLDVMLVHPDGSVTHVDFKAESDTETGKQWRTMHGKHFQEPHSENGRPVESSLEQHYALQAYVYRYGHQQLDPQVNIRGSLILPVHGVLGANGNLIAATLDRVPESGELFVTLPLTGAQLRRGAQEVMSIPGPEGPAAAEVDAEEADEGTESKKPTSKPKKVRKPKTEGSKGRAPNKGLQGNLKGVLKGLNKQGGGEGAKHSLDTVDPREYATNLSGPVRTAISNILRAANWTDGELSRLNRARQLETPLSQMTEAQKNAAREQVERDYVARFLRILQPDAELPVSRSARQWDMALGLEAMIYDLYAIRTKEFGHMLNWADMRRSGEISQETLEMLEQTETEMGQLWNQVNNLKASLGGFDGRAAREFRRLRKASHIHETLTNMTIDGYLFGDIYARLIDREEIRRRFSRDNMITRNDFGTLRLILDALTQDGGELDSDQAREDAQNIMSTFSDMISEQEVALQESINVYALTQDWDASLTGSQVTLQALRDLLDAEMNADNSSGDVRGSEKFFKSLRESGPAAKLRNSMRDALNALLPQSQEFDASEINMILHMIGTGTLREGRVEHDDNDFIKALVSEDEFYTWLYGKGAEQKDLAKIQQLALDVEVDRETWLEQIMMPALRQAFRQTRRVGLDGRADSFFEVRPQFAEGEESIVSAQAQAQAVIDAMPENMKKRSSIVLYDNPDRAGEQLAQVEVPLFSYDEAFKIGRVLEAQYVLPTNIVELMINIAPGDASAGRPNGLAASYEARLIPSNYGAEANTQRRRFRTYWSSENQDLLDVPEAIQDFTVDPNNPEPRITRADFLHRTLGFDLRLLQDLEKTTEGKLVLDQLAPENGVRRDVDSINAKYGFIEANRLLRYDRESRTYALNEDLYSSLTRFLGAVTPVGFTAPGLRYTRDLVFRSKEDAETAAGVISETLYEGLYTPVVYKADVSMEEGIPMLDSGRPLPTDEHWAITLYKPGIVAPRGQGTGLSQFAEALDAVDQGADASIADAAVSAAFAQLSSYLDTGRDFSLMNSIGAAAVGDTDAPRRLMDRYRNLEGNMVASYTGEFDMLLSVLDLVTELRNATGTGQDLQLGRIDGMRVDKYLRSLRSEPQSGVESAASENLAPSDLDFLRKALYKESVEINGHQFYWHILGQFGDKDHIFALLMPKYNSAEAAAAAYRTFYETGVLQHESLGATGFQTELSMMPDSRKAQVRERLLTPEYVESRSDRTTPYERAASNLHGYEEDAMLDPGFVAHQALHNAVIFNTAMGGMMSYKDFTEFLKRSGPAVTPGPTMHGGVVRQALNGREEFNAIVLDDFTPTSDRDREALRTAFPNEAEFDKALEMLNGMTFFTGAFNKQVMVPGFGSSLAREADFGTDRGFDTAKMLHSVSSSRGLGPEAIGNSRFLLKSNWINLEIFTAPIFRGTIYENLYNAVQKMNEGVPIEDQVHVLALKSGAKKYGPKSNITDIRDRDRSDWRLREDVTIDEVTKIPLHYSQLRMVQDLRKASEPKMRQLSLQMAYNMAPYSDMAIDGLAAMQEMRSDSVYVGTVLDNFYGDNLEARREVLDELVSPDGPNADLYEMLFAGVHPTFPAIESRVTPLLASFVSKNVIRQDVHRVLQQEISGADLGLERHRTVRYNADTDSYDTVDQNTDGAKVMFGGVVVTGKGVGGRRYRRDTRVPWENLRAAYNSTLAPSDAQITEYNRENFQTVMNQLLNYGVDLGYLRRLTPEEAGTKFLGRIEYVIERRTNKEPVERELLTDYSDLRELVKEDGKHARRGRDWMWQDIRYENGEVLIRGELWHHTRVPASEGAMHSFLRVTDVLEDVPVALVATDISTQIIAGADNDGDERHGAQLYTDDYGRYIFDRSYEGEMNRLFLDYQAVYQDPANTERLTRNVNTLMGRVNNLIKSGRMPHYTKRMSDPNAPELKWNHPGMYAKARTLNTVSQALRGIVSNIKSAYQASYDLGMATKSKAKFTLPPVTLDDGTPLSLEFGLPRDQFSLQAVDPDMQISSMLTVYQNLGFDAQSAGDEGPETMGLNETTAYITAALMILDPVAIEKAQEGERYTWTDAEERALAVANYMNSPFMRLYTAAARDNKGAVARGNVNALTKKGRQPQSQADAQYQAMVDKDKRLVGTVAQSKSLVKTLVTLGSEMNALSTVFYGATREAINSPSDYMNRMNVRDRVVRNAMTFFDTSNWYGANTEIRTERPNLKAPKSGNLSVRKAQRAAARRGTQVKGRFNQPIRDSLSAGWHEVSSEDGPRGISKLVDNSLRESYNVLRSGEMKSDKFLSALSQVWQEAGEYLPQINKQQVANKVREEQMNRYRTALRSAVLAFGIGYGADLYDGDDAAAQRMTSALEEFGEFINGTEWAEQLQSEDGEGVIAKTLEMMSTYAATRLLQLRSAGELQGNKLLYEVLKPAPGAAWDDGVVNEDTGELAPIRADAFQTLMEQILEKADIAEAGEIDWFAEAIDAATHLSVDVDPEFVGSETPAIDLYSMRGDFLQLAQVDNGLLGSALIASAVRYHTLSIADQSKSPLRFYGVEAVRGLSSIYENTLEKLNDKPLLYAPAAEKLTPGQQQRMDNSPWTRIINRAISDVSMTQRKHSLDDHLPRLPFRQVGARALMDSNRRLQWQLNELVKRGVQEAEDLLIMQGLLREREAYIVEDAVPGKFILYNGQREKMGTFDTFDEAWSRKREYDAARPKPTKEQVRWSELLNAAAMLVIEAPDMLEAEEDWVGAPLWTGRVERENGKKVQTPTGLKDQFGNPEVLYTLVMEDHTLQDVINHFGLDHLKKYVKAVQNAFANGRTFSNQYMEGAIDRDAYIQRRSNYLYHKYLLSNPHDVAEAKDSEKNSTISERVGRAAPRTYESYEVAAQTRGLEPKSMNLADMVRWWYEDTARVMYSQRVLIEGIGSNHWTGKPLWLPIFDISGQRDEYIRKLQKAGLDPDQIEERLRYETGIPDSVVRDALDKLVMAIDTHMAAKRSDTRVLDRVEDVYDRAGDARRQMFRVISEFRGELQDMGYRDFRGTEPSRFSSLTGWMVLELPEHDSPVESVSKQRDKTAANLLASLEQSRWNHWSIRKIQSVQNFMKWASLGLSAFHGFSLWESAVATAGLDDTGFWNPFRMGHRYRRVRNDFARAKADPDFGGRWLRHGLKIDVESAPDFNANPIIGALNRARTESPIGSAPVVRHGLGLLEGYGKLVDKYLWKTWMPSLMLYSAEATLQKHEQMYRDSHEGQDMDGATREVLMENISDYINVAFGTMDWTQFHQATPKVMQALHMGIFAPSWTASSLMMAVGDLPGMRSALGIKANPVALAEKGGAYWPAMVLYVMTVLPAVLQAAMKATLSPDDDEMAWIPALNEKGKRGLAGVGGHMDWTPLYRALGLWDGGTTGKQRVYMRYAKQATEVFEGWATRPVDTFFGKTSLGVKLAFEQFSGETMNGWELDFKDQGFAKSLVAGKTKGFRGSRTYNVLQKFIPIGIQAYMDDRPVSPFAPVSTGMSMFKAQEQYGRVLATYAEEATYKHLKDNPKARLNLDRIGKDILAAAEKNGIDPDEVVKQAKRRVLTQYYTQMFHALEKGDFKGVERAAARAVRANGKYRDALRAMENRYGRINQKLTKEERKELRRIYRGE